MSIFQRQGPGPDNVYPSDNAPNGQPAGGEHPGSVGYLLRSTREGFGWQLADVSAALRIRQEYLKALEANTLAGLPGPAYATGFLRAYADYLGLDGTVLAQRFKNEQSGLHNRPELTFPVPLTERNIPGLGFFLIAVLIAALGYGTWYYISSSDHVSPRAVEAVPKRLLDSPPVPPAPEPATATTPPATTAPAASTPAVPASTVPASTATTSTATAATASPPAAQPAPAGAATGVAGTPETAAPTTPSAQPAATGTTPAAGAPAAGASPSATSAPATPAGPAATPATPASTAGMTLPGIGLVPPAAGAPDTKASDPHSYGSIDAPGRIVIKATARSWVKFYENRKAVYQRGFNPGDVYFVPNKPGMAMFVGNAGGLEVFVDGKALPPVGHEGEVLRHVDLDADKLTGKAAGAPASSLAAPATPPEGAPAAPASTGENDD